MEVGPYVGVARHSLVGTHLGATPDQNHLFLGVHTVANFVRTRRFAVAYAPEVVPLLLISSNSTYRAFPDPYGFPYIVREEQPNRVPGFAVSPLGLEAQARIASRWRVYAASAGGVVWFTREVPISGAGTFDYTFEVGGGLLWRCAPRDSLRMGYKFHHLSNGYRTSFNPGIDGAVFLVGYERAFVR